MVRGSCAREAKYPLRPFLGMKPSCTKRSVGKPLAAKAESPALGPGITVIGIPRVRAPEDKTYPGSLMAGIPASLTTTTSDSAATSNTRSATDASECSLAANTVAEVVMSRAFMSLWIIRVSSATINEALASTWANRGEASPKLPIGVAARISIELTRQLFGQGHSIAHGQFTNPFGAHIGSGNLGRGPALKNTKTCIQELLGLG